MPVDSVATLAESLRRGRLLDARQLDEVTHQLLPRFPQPPALARELVRRGWLTPYQVNQIFQGRGEGLLLGSYVLLERLGEGGMGQVFKARNWKLGAIVAIKVIRKDRLANEVAVLRFQREIRVVAQLDHPNIVRALDADQAGDTHFLVMDYVEGTDLAKLIKEHGPLSPALACDLARQAALALQHAHERGLIHRDIKPANLLLVQAPAPRSVGLLKVLDMGLARLQAPSDGGQSSDMLTREGAIMGSLDYLAPEQAMDSHTVDIRADLYGLGCTLYFLLTGEVPFPGGGPMDKLLRHRTDEPPLEELRPGVPAAVATVLRRLMAKRPEDRYQTPAEAAEALAAAVRAEIPSATEIAVAREVASRPLPELPSQAMTDTAEGWSSILTPDATPKAAPPPNRRPLWIGLVVGIVLLALAAGLLLLLLHTLGQPSGQKAEVEQPPVAKEPTKVDAVWLRKVAALPADEQVQAVAEKLHDLNPEFDGTVKPGIENGAVTALGFSVDGVTDLSPVRALGGLKTLTLTGTRGKAALADLAPLKGLRLSTLTCTGTPVSDLAPLKDMPLTWLNLDGCQVADLTPLKALPLIVLSLGNNPVANLAPLKGMKLTGFNCGGTQVADLTPLQGMPLDNLRCDGTRVTDLSPLKGMRLTRLDFERTAAADLSMLRDMPLKDLRCDFNPWRTDAEVPRALRTLQTINGEPIAAFWARIDDERADFDFWAKQVAVMKANEQVQAVTEELKKRNKGLDGKPKHQVDNGAVVGLTFTADEVADLLPVRALPALTSLTCTGAGKDRSKLTDLGPLKGLALTRLNVSGTGVMSLSPLKGIPLTDLNCNATAVADLTPLKGLPLEELRCHGTTVADLAPLQKMPLTYLDCGGTRVTDLSALKGMPLRGLDCSTATLVNLSPLAGLPLKTLSCQSSKVADLSPLKGLPLEELRCDATLVADLSPLGDAPLTILDCRTTRVSDLSPLTKMPLKRLSCDLSLWRDAEALRPIKTLEAINGTPPAQVWKALDDFEAWAKTIPELKPVEQQKALVQELKKRNKGFDGKVKRTVEKGAIVSLEISADDVTDLSPVRALPGLKRLSCQGSAVGKGKLADLWPLRGLALTSLGCARTRVMDLAALRGMGLTELWVGGNGVRDLSPLKGMRLTTLACDDSLVADLSPLQDMPLTSLWCDFRPERDAAILRSIKTLVRLNDKPAEELLK